jgi:hypothetical protein
VEKVDLVEQASLDLAVLGRELLSRIAAALVEWEPGVIGMF